MEQVIECPCGAMLRDVDEEVLVEEAKRHANEVHDMDLSSEQARDMMRPA